MSRVISLGYKSRFGVPRSGTGIFLLFLVSACYSPSINNTEYRIDPIIQPYLNRFDSIAATYGKSFEHNNLIISTEYGLARQYQCYGLTTLRSNGGQRQIEFDLQYWNESSESVKQLLTLHEFGHAFLGRIHSKEYSIMNPTIGYNGWPDKDHKPLLDELFKQ